MKTKEQKIREIANELDRIWNDRVFDILREENDWINSVNDIDEYIELENAGIELFAKELLGIK